MTEGGPGVREAQPEDAQRIAVLLDEAFGPGGSGSTDPGTVDLAHRYVVPGPVTAVDATALSTPCGQWFGGRSVPSRAVAAVAVASDARGTGAGRTLMTELLRHEAEAGAAVMCLYPSTVRFYRSLGFDIAGQHVRSRVEVLDLPRLRAPNVRVADVPDLGVLEPLYRQGVAGLHGPLDRTEEWWGKHVLARLVPGKRWTVVVAAGSEVSGYAVVSKARPRTDAEYQHDLVVHDLAWRDADAAAELLGYFRGFASLGQAVSWPSAPGDVWLSLLEGRGPMPDASSHPWMLRVLDVPGALSARGWPAGLELELSLAVTDAQVPRNNGSWAVAVAGGRATVAATTAPADLSLDASALASLYSGWCSVSDLVRRGAAALRDDRLASRLDACFTGRPWLGERF